MFALYSFIKDTITKLCHRLTPYDFLVQDILFLRAVLARKRGKTTEEVVTLLNEASTTHFGALKGIPLGIDYYSQMNPDFVLELVKEYLNFAPTEVR